MTISPIIVVLSGCDDRTAFEWTPPIGTSRRQALDLLHSLADASQAASQYSCMPRLRIGDEDDLL